MPTVKDALKSYLGAPTFGGPRTTSNQSMRRDQLAKNLRRISESNGRYFNICFGATVVLFLFSIGASLWFLTSPGQITLLFTALGISVTGLIVEMTKLWRQKVSSDTLLAIAGAATETQLDEIMRKLLEGCR